MEFGECIDEAAEQAGLDPAALTHRHLNSMTRSFDLVMIEIENEGAKPEYRMETSTFTINAGDGVIVLPEDTVDVTEVVISSGDSDLGMTRTHRDDYLRLTNKEGRGRPVMYFVSKSLNDEANLITDPTGYGAGPISTGMWGGVVSPTPNLVDPKMLVVWPINDTDGVKIKVNRLRYAGAPSLLSEKLDARRNWLDTICTGLAARTAQKWNIDRFDMLSALFRDKLKRRLQSEDLGPVYIAFRAHGFSRRRRH